MMRAVRETSVRALRLLLVIGIGVWTVYTFFPRQA